MNRSGRFVLAWMDFRDTATGSDAYCQAYRADGSAIGPNVRVNTDAGNSYQATRRARLTNRAGMS